jgi:hypothetical protein
MTSRTITSSANRINTRNSCSLKCSAARKAAKARDFRMSNLRLAASFDFRSHAEMSAFQRDTRGTVIIFIFRTNLSSFTYVRIRRCFSSHYSVCNAVRALSRVIKCENPSRAAQQWLPDYGQATFACTNPSIATNSVENFPVTSHARHPIG